MRIHSQHSKKGGRQDRMEEKLRYHYQYHYHPTLTDEEVGKGKKGGRTSENSVTLSLMLIWISTSNFRRHYQPHAGPKS